MKVAERIRTVMERNSRALELRPSIGRGTAVTKVRLREGLACDIEEGKWRLKADMSAKSGGDETGPNPGILGRASLGSCLAISYAMRAARSGVPIRSLEIEVEADYDTRSEYGLDGVKPGYRQVRCIVTVDSDAPPEILRRLFEEASDTTSYLHIWREPQDVRVDLRIAREA